MYTLFLLISTLEFSALKDTGMEFKTLESCLSFATLVKERAEKRKGTKVTILCRMKGELIERI